MVSSSSADHNPQIKGYIMKIGVKWNKELSKDFPERPLSTDVDIVKSAAAMTARDACAHYGVSDKHEDDLYQSLVRCGDPFMSGYELAKEIESDTGWAGIDTSFIEALDNYSDNLDAAHQQACKKWAKKFSVNPSLKEGDVVEFDRRIKRVTGVIHHLYLYEGRVATYSIKEDDSKDDNRFLILPFEEVFLKT